MHQSPSAIDGAGWQGADTLRLVFEAAPSAMLLVGRDGLIRLVNEQAEILLGYGRGELLGRPVEDLVPERFRAAHPSQRDSFFAQAAVRAIGTGRDLFARRKDGGEVPVEIGLNPIVCGGEPCAVAAIIDISQRKRGEELLRAALREKETLLREIHHRVKNNMQVVSSILGLQAGYIDDPRFRAMLDACQARVRAMALIHEKLYGADSLGTVAFDDYARALARMLATVHAADRAGITLDVATEPLRIDAQRAIPLGLILNELITNALQHAFTATDRGTVRVELARGAAGCGRLAVADDGVGLPAGFHLAEARSLGLRIVRGLVDQLDGELRVVPGAGVRFEVDFPLPAVDPV